MPFSSCALSIIFICTRKSNLALKAETSVCSIIIKSDMTLMISITLSDNILLVVDIA